MPNWPSTELQREIHCGIDPAKRGFASFDWLSVGNRLAVTLLRSSYRFVAVCAVKGHTMTRNPISNVRSVTSHSNWHAVLVRVLSRLTIIVLAFAFLLSAPAGRASDQPDLLNPYAPSVSSERAPQVGRPHTPRHHRDGKGWFYQPRGAQPPAAATEPEPVRVAQATRDRHAANDRLFAKSRTLACVAGCSHRAPVAVGRSTMVRASRYHVGHASDRHYPTGIKCNRRDGCWAKCPRSGCPKGPYAIRRTPKYEFYFYYR